MPCVKESLNKRSVGTMYEQVAKNYLLKQGYQILCSNYRCKLGEIDLIAKKEEYIVFIEVKYRKNNQYGYPREAVNYFKQQRIKRVAQFYLKCYMRYESKCRFDVIEILSQTITHLENVF